MTEVAADRSVPFSAREHHAFDVVHRHVSWGQWNPEAVWIVQRMHPLHLALAIQRDDARAAITPRLSPEGEWQLDEQIAHTLAIGADERDAARVCEPQSASGVAAPSGASREAAVAAGGRRPPTRERRRRQPPPSLCRHFPASTTPTPQHTRPCPWCLGWSSMAARWILVVVTAAPPVPGDLDPSRPVARGPLHRCRQVDPCAVGSAVLANVRPRRKRRSWTRAAARCPRTR